MKKRIFALALGMMLGVGVLAATAPATVLAAECTSTSNHVSNVSLTPGDGSITVNLNAWWTPGESNGVYLIFCESQKSDLSMDSTEFRNENFTVDIYESGVLTVKSTKMWDYALNDLVELTLKKGTTYYVYASCFNQSCGEGEHDYMYLGSCVAEIGAAQTPAVPTPAPAPAEPAPVAAEVTPTPAEPAPVAAEVTPTPAEPEPVAAEATPTPALPAPVAAEPTPTPPAPVASEGSGSAAVYTVKPGDTLNRIAKEHGMTLAELVAKNPQIRNVNMIRVGQTIQLTGSGAVNASGTIYTVQAGDTMNRIAKANGMTLAELVAKNPQIQNVNKIKVGQTINL